MSEIARNLIHNYWLEEMKLRLCVLLPLLVACCTPHFAVGELVVLGQASPVTVRLGDEATLPCWLSPSMNAEDLEVRWYLEGQFDDPILLYRGREEFLHTDFVGRTSFGLRNPKSTGLVGGDVTIKLSNVTLKDEREYQCYVSSDKGYDHANIRLNVTVMGSSPLISVQWKEDGKGIVSCESSGWHPRPMLRWSDERQTLAHQSLVYTTQPDGLVTVHSWLLATSSKISCSISLTEEKEEREGWVKLEAPESPSGFWKPAFFALLVICTFTIIGVFLYLRKKGKDKSENKLIKDEKTLVSLEEAKRHGVSVKVSDNHGFLRIKDGKVMRDRNDVRYPDDENVPLVTSVLGITGISSGCAYWEVRLGNETVGLKKFWWVGVATKPLPEGLPPTPSNGLFFLSSDNHDRFQVNAAPGLLLSVTTRPEILGVFCDYDNEQVSFYNVKENMRIVTLATMFKGEVFPLFNPGKGDIAPLTILDVATIALPVSENEPFLP